MSSKEEELLDDVEDVEDDVESSEEEESGDEDEDDDEDEDEDVSEEEEGDGATEQESSSDDENSEKCAICLAKLRAQQVGTPESCDHTFCLECIQEWSKNINTCPVDRQVFNLILGRNCLNGKVITKIKVENKQLEEEEEEDLTFCEVCGRSDREDRLLLCDGCDLGFHCECIDPPLDNVPVEEWFCQDCVARQPPDEPSMEVEVDDFIPAQPRRRIARTRVSERVRQHIRQMRTNQAALTRELDTSSEEEDEEEDNMDLEDKESSASATSTPAKPRRKPVRRKTTKKRKTSRKRKSTSKKPRKRKVKRKTTKRRTRKKKKRVVKPVTSTTVKKRLASRLGLVKPPTGHSMPLVKAAGDKEVDIGVAPLSILGHKDDLDSLDIGSDNGELPCTSSGSRRREKYSASSRKSRQPIGRPRAISEISSSTSDNAGSFLDSIMHGQSMLHLDSKDVTIHRDGSLKVKPGTKPKCSKPQNSGETTGEEAVSSNVFSTSETETDNVELEPAPNSNANGANEAEEACGTTPEKHETGATVADKTGQNDSESHENEMSGDEKDLTKVNMSNSVDSKTKSEESETATDKSVNQAISVMASESENKPGDSDGDYQTITCEITSYDSDSIGLKIASSPEKATHNAPVLSNDDDSQLSTASNVSSGKLVSAKSKQSRMENSGSEMSDVEDELEVFIPKVPISELPRIPKLKRTKKAEEIIVEEPVVKKPRGVLSKLDTPELSESNPKLVKPISKTVSPKDIRGSLTEKLGSNRMSGDVRSPDKKDSYSRSRYESEDKGRGSSRSERDSKYARKDVSVKDEWLEKVHGKTTVNEEKGEKLKIQSGNVNNNALSNDDKRQSRDRHSRTDEKRSRSQERERSDRLGGDRERQHRSGREDSHRENHRSERTRSDEAIKNDRHSSSRGSREKREEDAHRVGDREEARRERRREGRPSRFDNGGKTASSSTDSKPSNLPTKQGNITGSESVLGAKREATKPNSGILPLLSPTQNKQQLLEYDPFNPTDSDSPVPEAPPLPDATQQLLSQMEEQGLIGHHMTPDLATMAMLGQRPMMVNPLLMGGLPQLGLPPGWPHLPPGLQPGIMGSQPGIMGNPRMHLPGGMGLPSHAELMASMPQHLRLPGAPGGMFAMTVPGEMAMAPPGMQARMKLGLPPQMQDGAKFQVPASLHAQMQEGGKFQVPASLHTQMQDGAKFQVPASLLAQMQDGAKFQVPASLHAQMQDGAKFQVPASLHAQMQDGGTFQVPASLHAQMQDGAKFQVPASLHASLANQNPAAFTLPSGIQGRPSIIDPHGRVSPRLPPMHEHMLQSSMGSVPVSHHSDPRLPPHLMEQLSQVRLPGHVLPHTMVNTRLPPPLTVQSAMKNDSNLMPPPAGTQPPPPPPRSPSVMSAQHLPLPIPHLGFLGRHPNPSLPPPPPPQDNLHSLMPPPRLPPHGAISHNDIKLMSIPVPGKTQPPNIQQLLTSASLNHRLGNMDMSALPIRLQQSILTNTNMTTTVKSMSPDIQEIDMEVESPLDDDSITYSPGDEDFTKIVDVLETADDLPSSAVEFDRSQKLLKKMNRQERVVDEVKMAIKPFYNDKEINKKEYKEIMRKAVPKICHSKSGDINPAKIKSLVEGYVNHMKKMKKYLISKKASRK